MLRVVYCCLVCVAVACCSLRVVVVSLRVARGVQHDVSCCLLLSSIGDCCLSFGVVAGWLQLVACCLLFR